jgi:prevent-host-death family protein
MKEIRASIFKARCLAIMDKVQATGEQAIITKHGIPIVKIMPVQAAEEEIFGFMAGKVKVVGDIESPTVPQKHWNVTR